MKIVWTALLALICFVSQAGVVLPDIISDNMVLQQNARIRLWGMARADSEITITTSWDSRRYTTKSDEGGKWIIEVQTPGASSVPQRLTFSDGEELTLDNILIGEVWLCSGQSNMEMPLKGLFNGPVEGGNDAIANAGQYPSIRVATIRNTGSVVPQETVAGKWKISNSENAGSFSAVAYFFAVYLNRVLNVPVGVIDCSWGGSHIEGWMPEELLSRYEDVDISNAGNPEVADWAQPMIMYNGMLHPLHNYTIRGFLWYQGESNIGRHETYPGRMADMAALWRGKWGLGELPFYYVEIAPYDYGDARGDWAALLREAQYKAQALIPNSGMVSTNDLVGDFESDNIHPRNKKTIGERLAYMALRNTYGMNGIADRGPEYVRMEIVDGEAYLSFNHAPEGFNRFAGMSGFEVAAEDRIFHPAEARMADGGRIMVRSDAVKTPVAVRYCFRNYQPGNVANTRELPMVPFRTDNW